VNDGRAPSGEAGGVSPPEAALPESEVSPSADGSAAAGPVVAGPDAAPQPSPAGAATGTPRVPSFSFFFPAHDEAENIEALVDEALAALPALAERFEIIAVDDGSTDATPAIADRLAAEHAGVVRAVHHDVNRGYGAALRSGFAAARYPVVGFIDGDRQFRVVDLGLLLERLEAPDRPDAVVGHRLERADSRLRLAYARAYRACLRAFFGLAVHDVDCACKVFRRDALADVRLESGGAFLSAELLIKLGARGRRVVEVGVPHYPRLAGRASGANPRVVGRAVRDFWLLRLRLWANRRRALARGARVLGDAG
jgi:glycosyltransferase involved in cell wall biosynthesis